MTSLPKPDGPAQPDLSTAEPAESASRLAALTTEIAELQQSVAAKTTQVKEKSVIAQALNKHKADREQTVQDLTSQVVHLNRDLSVIYGAKSGWWFKLCYGLSGRMRRLLSLRPRRPVLPAKLRRFKRAVYLYLGNHWINQIPSFRVRHWYYRHVLHYSIGRESSIHMGTFVTGDLISIGDNVVINRHCYLDGRVGLEIRNNVNISPEVYIVSMEHDPDSPTFATRGGLVVIEDNVWVGARAMITPGVTLGEGAVIGAGAVVVRSVAPYRIAVGVPAREIRDRCRCLIYRSRYFPWFDTDVQR
jgi:acetyltransferase-like isoleucine patch superfamily enzyme